MSDDVDPSETASDGVDAEWQRRFPVAPSEHHSEAVVRSVAVATSREPTDLPILYETIDPGALDRLLTRLSAGSGSDVQVSFDYAGVRIVVDAATVSLPPATVT